MRRLICSLSTIELYTHQFILILYLPSIPTCCSFGVSVDETGEPSDPNICFVRRVGYQVHRLKVISEHNRKGTFVWVYPCNVLVFQCFCCFTTSNLLDGRYWDWNETKWIFILKRNWQDAAKFINELDRDGTFVSIHKVTKWMFFSEVLLNRANNRLPFILP